MYTVERGNCRLGATVEYDGVNFAIFSKNGEAAVLNIFEREEDDLPVFSYYLDEKKNRTGDIWHVYLKNAEPGLFYTWNIGGIFDEMEGHRFDIGNHLLDPYGKVYTPKIGERFQKSVVIDESFLKRDIERPGYSVEDTIIYEMHISLFTKNGNSGVTFPGTYRGVEEKIPYLKELGITAVEFLPVCEFDDYAFGVNPVTGEKLKNVWGYNSLGFFALTSKYFSGEPDLENRYEKQLLEFKNLVDKLHENGIEVILDVVYNHTAEGNENGPTLNFKGIDNTIFYILENDKKYYSNYSGTGNTVNCNHPAVKNMILDSLRYWYTVIGVDGFRFDLGAILGRNGKGHWLGGENSLLNDIAKDPILADAKFTAEAWDAAGGYFLTEFPENFGIWNGKYRDAVRGFIRGDEGKVGEIVQRVMGSPDLFKYNGKRPVNSVNFITAHDGFTMWDLVAYDCKNNIANGECNRDGEHHNNSWNHGYEGETENRKIIELRKRQMKNMAVFLMVSQGIPMLLMGDEMAKTQTGNNNAYCQDSELNWLDWERAESFRDIFSFFRDMIRFRKEHKSLRQPEYRSRDGEISVHGIKPFAPDMSHDSHTIAFMFEYEKTPEIYVAFNAYYKSLEFELPKIHGKKWYLVADTAIPGEESFLKERVPLGDEFYKLAARSSIIAMAY